MQFIDRIAMRIGALPARRVTWGLVAIFSIWVVLDIFAFKVSGGLAQSSYDAMVRARVFVPAPDPRVVIVDIDEASLAKMGKEFGRWPWPRDTLATVLDFIEQQQPAAIVWDVLFSEADRMSPGGDAAFDAAVGRSHHSHFSVVRLPAANDGVSQITRSALPGLWIPSAENSIAPANASTVALIPPALPHIAAGNLGFNNGYVDSDGVLRRYRYLEQLPDGSAISAISLRALSAIDPGAYDDYLARANDSVDLKDELVVWRKNANAYPHVSFVDVFAKADGAQVSAPVPAFAGKVVIIGATAPSLHDIHPTPLSSMQAGVDTLATVLDNAMNAHYLRELPRGLQAALAIALCVALALWVQFYSVASLTPALLALPAALLGISYMSLNGLPVFIDMHLAAGLALVFLAVLRFWSNMRKAYWCSLPPDDGQPLAMWPLERSKAWLDGPLDRLIDALERDAPDCRVVVNDTTVVWPSALRWPELARFAAIVGPEKTLRASLVHLRPAVLRLTDQQGDVAALGNDGGRDAVAAAFLTLCSVMREHEIQKTKGQK